MSIKKYILILLLSLSTQNLIKAEVLRKNFGNDENSINQRFELLEREVARLKTDNRYLRFKLDKMEQMTKKLEEEMENLNRKSNETAAGTVSAAAMRQKLEGKDLQTPLFNCLLQNYFGAVQNEVELKETPLNEQNNSKNYDEHFNCINNCDKIDSIPKNCAEALGINRTSDGVYLLQASNSSLAPFYAYCLQDAYGDNAWLVIQRRQVGEVSFARRWSEYVEGFGDLNGDYWLGLKRLHALTSARKYELWIQMKDNAGMGRYANYDEFVIGNETEKFKMIKLGEYVGDAFNSLGFNYGAQFSTYDRDNDNDEEHNCAEERMSGWWFDDCKHSLNGVYNSSDYGTGINWIGWHDYRYSLKYVHIAIRPVSVDLMQKTPMVVKPVFVDQ